MRLAASLLACVAIAACGGPAAAPTPTQPQTPASTSSIDNHTVSGTVRDDTGAPVADATVFVGCGGCKTGPGFSTTTNANGFYSGKIRAGTFDMSVRKPGYTTLSIYGSVVVTGDITRDVTLKPGVIISGRTYEEGVGDLIGVRVEVITGPDAGTADTTGSPGVPNAYSFSVRPGTFRIRATKDGYVPIERDITAPVDARNVDFTLKWEYGSCLRSVSPLVFNSYASAGGEETIVVDAYPDRDWTVAADQPWLSIMSPAEQDGPGQVVLRVLPHPPGAQEARRGTIMIRCGASAGQNVWVVQNPDCQARLTPHADTPAVFPASGGTGRLYISTGVPQCRWQSSSTVDWIRAVGVNSWRGSYDNVAFVVEPNTTGRPRTGFFVVGEQVWTVRQN